jgi:hypothetical protein
MGVKKSHRDRTFMDSINLGCPLPSDDRPECCAELCMMIALLMSTAPLAISNALPARVTRFQSTVRKRQPEQSSPMLR